MNDATENTRAVLQTAMHMLVQMFPNTSITILIAPLNAPENARTNYVSNTDRATMLVLFKEIVARFEGRTILRTQDTPSTYQ